MEKEEIRCRRYGHDAAVFMLDLDGLKHVNDTYGHSHGDALIVLAAVVLQSMVREVDIIARIGGDEFGVVAIECTAESAESLVERMQTQFENYDVQVSIGYALRLASGGLKGAWERADALMYEEKTRRKAIS